MDNKLMEQNREPRKKILTHMVIFITDLQISAVREKLAFKTN